MTGNDDYDWFIASYFSKYYLIKSGSKHSFHHCDDKKYQQNGDFYHKILQFCQSSLVYIYTRYVIEGSYKWQ